MVECVGGSGCMTCFVLSFAGRMVSPLSTSIYHYCVRHLLDCCSTWVGGSLRGRHCCCTTFCRTAVSGWVDRFIAVVVCSCRVFTPSWDIFSFFLPLYGPRAGILQRTTSINILPEVVPGTSSQQTGPAVSPSPVSDLYAFLLLWARYDMYVGNSCFSSPRCSWLRVMGHMVVVGVIRTSSLSHP